MTNQYYRNQKADVSLALGSRRHLKNRSHKTAAVGRPGREMADVTLDAQSGAVKGSLQGAVQTPLHDQAKGDAQDWLSSVESANLTPRYFLTVGLLVIQERRHQGRKNDPNLIRIISREWQAWVRRGRLRAVPEHLRRTGCNDRHPTDMGVLNTGKTGPAEPPQGLPEDSARSTPKRLAANPRE